MIQYDVLCTSISIRFSKKYYMDMEYMCFENMDKHIERQKGITRRTKTKMKNNFINLIGLNIIVGIDGQSLIPSNSIL